MAGKHWWISDTRQASRKRILTISTKHRVVVDRGYLFQEARIHHGEHTEEGELWATNHSGKNVYRVLLPVSNDEEGYASSTKWKHSSTGLVGGAFHNDLQVDDHCLAETWWRASVM